jgi:ribosomal protein L1
VQETQWVEMDYYAIAPDAVKLIRDEFGQFTGWEPNGTMPTLSDTQINSIIKAIQDITYSARYETGGFGFTFPLHEVIFW